MQDGSAAVPQTNRNLQVQRKCFHNIDLTRNLSGVKDHITRSVVEAHSQKESKNNL